MNGWIILLLAGLFEIGFTTFMKLSEGFSRWSFNIGFAICAIASFMLLNKSTMSIPLGTAYAVWTGIGAFGTAIIGMVFFKDPFTLWRSVFLSLLILSIIGLKFVAPEGE